MFQFNRYATRLTLYWRRCGERSDCVGFGCAAEPRTPFALTLHYSQFDFINMLSEKNLFWLDGDQFGAAVFL